MIDEESVNLLSGLRSDTLERLAKGAPLAEILETIARGIERTSPGSLASIHLVRDGRLYEGASPTLPREYLEALEGLKIGPSVGTCGTSAYTAARVISSDIQSDPRWESLREQTRVAQVAACWSEPIIDSRGVVVGTFGIYHRAPASPTPRDLYIVEAAAELAAITIEKSQAEEALRTSERRLSLALRGANEGLWEYDFIADRHYFSPRFARILGYEPDTYPPDSRAWLALTHPDDAARNDEEFARILRDADDTLSVEVRMRHCSGEWRTILSRSHVVRDADGQPAQLIGTILDITEHRRTQNELEEALKAAQAASEAKSEFLTMMSHELRTPLHAILGMSELLLEAKLDAREHHYAEIVRDSATTLRDIIRDILDTSKIEAGKLELRRVPFDLRELFCGFFDRYALRAHTKGIDFYEVIDPALPTTVIGDPTRLRQILDNLASNALKFTAEGTITVEVSGCASADADAVDLEFRVRDTGVGIPEDAHDRLFQPFVQVDGSTSRSFDGTGLGLMIARQLATMMGGELRLEESAPDRGSTFLFRCALPLAPTQTAPIPRVPPTRVAALIRSPGFAASLRADCAAIGATLEIVDDAAALRRDPAPDVVLVESRAPPRELPAPPAAAVDSRWRTIVVLEPGGSALTETALALGWERCLLRPFRRETLRRSILGDEAESPASAPAPEPPRRDATILLVEDNLVNHEVAVAMLSALGFTAIDHAENGAVAIEKATARTYDLILMDCVMPKVDGFEATRHLRAAGYRGPIVAMTASTLERERRRAAEAGMDEFATKPLGPARLAEILERWIGSSSASG